jgi:hypothetical protein
MGAVTNDKKTFHGIHHARCEHVQFYKLMAALLLIQTRKTSNESGIQCIEVEHKCEYNVRALHTQTAYLLQYLKMGFRYFHMHNLSHIARYTTPY